MTPRTPKPPASPPARGTFVVTSMEQARVLVDPLRARILREFVDVPLTTKQVADRLNEKPTRLYRHVDALAKAGLLTFKGERKKRGTVERYFQAVASRFEIGRSLLLAKDDAAFLEGGGQDLIRRIFKDAEADIVTAVETCDDDDELGPFAMRAEIRAGESDIRRLRQKLLDWMDECSAEDRPEGEAPGDLHFGAVVAFFPVRRES